MIVETPDERRRQEINHSYATMTSSSTLDDSPLRAFLRLNRNAIDAKRTLERKVSSVGSDFLAPAALSRSRNKVSPNKREGYLIHIGEDNESTFSSDQKKERNQRKENLNVQSKEEAMQSLMQSYHTLNNLMQRTASSRCLLLQQSKKNNIPSEPLMKSLSTSAFKTIVTANKITSSISATSFRKITTVPETLNASDCINSSFDEIIQHSEHQPKKRRMSSVIHRNSFASTQDHSRNSEDLRQESVTGVEPSVSSLIHSLPSCGSLASTSSESECTFEQVIQKPSPFPPSEITTAIQVIPVGRKEILFQGSIPTNSCSEDVHSCGSLDNSSLLRDEQKMEEPIQALPSASSGLEMSRSSQTRNRFKSSQVPNSMSTQSSPSLGLGISSSFHTRNKANSFPATPGKIDKSPSSLQLSISSLLQTRKKNSSFKAPSGKIHQSSSSIELGKSSSFQTKRKFNSFQAPNSMSDQFSCNPIPDSSLGDLPLMFQRQGNICRNTKSYNISDAMKLKLRRELGLHEQSNVSWLSNNNR